MPAPAPSTAAIAAAAMKPPARCLGRSTTGAGRERAQRRDTRRSGKVSSGVGPVLASRLDDRVLLTGARRLRMIGEVWESGLLVLVHGYDSDAEPYVHAVRRE